MVIWMISTSPRNRHSQHGDKSWLTAVFFGGFEMHLIVAVLCQNRDSGISPYTDSGDLQCAFPRSVLHVTAQPSPSRVSVTLTHHRCFNTHHEKRDYSTITLHKLMLDGMSCRDIIGTSLGTLSIVSLQHWTRGKADTALQKQGQQWMLRWRCGLFQYHVPLAPSG